MINEDGFDAFKDRLEQEQLNALEALAGVGPVTKQNLAKNIGLQDAAKPDVWLARCADACSAGGVEVLVSLLRETSSASKAHEIGTILWNYCQQFQAVPSRADATATGLMDQTGATESVTIVESESIVWQLDGVRIVVRDWSDDWVRGYDYKNKANRNWRTATILTSGTALYTLDREVDAVDGWGERPHGNTRLQSLRDSYLESGVEWRSPRRPGLRCLRIDSAFCFRRLCSSIRLKTLSWATATEAAAGRPSSAR